MPSIRFNCEGSQAEAPASLSVTRERGLVTVSARRNPATKLVVTFSMTQVRSLFNMLKGTLDDAEAHADRRP